MDTTSAALIDTGAMRAHHTLIWANRGDGSPRLAVVHRTAAGRMATERVGIDDVDGLVAIASKHAAVSDVWVNVGPQPPGVEGRGGKRDVLWLPALVADVDTADGVHAGGKVPLPTRSEADELIASLPFHPTLTVATGGGLHVWLAVDEPLMPGGETDALLARWKQLWMTTFEAAGRLLDVGVLADWARMLRLAGTANHKGAEPRPVSIVSTGERIGLGELAAVLPPLAAKAPRGAKTKTAKPTKPSADSDEDVFPADFEPCRPGDALKRSVPVSALIKHLGWKQGKAPGAWVRPDSTSGDADTEIYVNSETGIETVTQFSATAQAAWGLDGQDHALSSWDVLGRVVCGGDWKLAARIAANYPTTEQLLELLSAYPSVEQLREAVPPMTTSVAEAAASIDPNVSVDVTITPGLVARIGGSQPGLYRFSRDDDGNLQSVAVTDGWVAWRPSVVSSLEPDELTGKPREVEKPTYAVKLLRRDGRSFEVDGLTAAESVRPETVLDTLNAGVVLPETQNGRRQVESMLRGLGHAEQHRDDSWRTTGWMVDAEGRATWLAPVGSVGADGVRDDLVVIHPSGSAPSALVKSQRLTGFIELSSDLSSDLGSIRDLIAICPKRPELGAALIGAAFSAPLSLSTRSCVVLVGEPNAGKSLLASAAQSFFSGVGIVKNAFSVSIPSSSQVGASIASSWHRDGVCFFDDYRLIGDDDRANTRMTGIITAAAQQAYGGEDGRKGTVTGGLRDSRVQSSTAIVTAETAPEQPAILDRSVVLNLLRGELPQERPAPIDDFRDKWVTPGGARRVMASYLAYLARRIEAAGGMVVWRAEMDAQSISAFQDLGGSTRAEELVAIPALGWRMLREFAAEMGVADALPSESEVHAWLRMVLDANIRERREADYGRRLLRALRDMLSANRGHLTNYVDRQPTEVSSPGWRYEDGFKDGEGVWKPQGNLLGRLSEDNEWVVVSTRSLKDIQRDAKLGGLRDTQIERALAPFAMDGTGPRKRCPKELGIKRPERPRGFAFPAKILDVGMTQAARESAEEDAKEPF